jgi:hypothetical protein
MGYRIASIDIGYLGGIIVLVYELDEVMRDVVDEDLCSITDCRRRSEN